MKNILSLLIICLLISCSQNRYHIDETTNPTNTLRYLKSDMSLLSGVVFNIYENGQLSFENTYEDGRLNGLCKEWHENGLLKSEGYFISGEENGLHKTWCNKGKIVRERNYINGNYEGQWGGIEHENQKLY